MNEVQLRIEPFDLPRVKKVHYPGIFGEFKSVLSHRIGELQELGNGFATKKIALFRYLLDTIDASAFAAIQDEYLAPGKIDPESDLFKYIDPIVWLESKLVIAHRIGLHDSAPKRMIDFGTGPGHFPVVANFLGHSIVGTEVPRRSSGDLTAHLYDRLCELYGVRRISHIITPNPDLRDLGGPYDFATSFLTAFNVDARKQPWPASSWKDFFHELRAYVLKPHGSLYMTLANNKITPASWRFLSRLATTSNDTSRTLFFENLAFLDAPSVRINEAAQ